MMMDELVVTPYPGPMARGKAKTSWTRDELADELVATPQVAEMIREKVGRAISATRVKEILAHPLAPKPFKPARDQIWLRSEWDEFLALDRRPGQAGQKLIKEHLDDAHGAGAA